MLVAATLLIADHVSIANASIGIVLQLATRGLVEAVADGLGFGAQCARITVVGLHDVVVDEGKTKVIVIIPMTT